jgi:hypothetical protein
MFGRYPSPAAIRIDYAAGIRSELEMSDLAIDASAPLASELNAHQSLTPLSFTQFDLAIGRGASNWLTPGIVLGDVTSFDDLLLFWNLRAAGALVLFYDPKLANRLGSFVNAFLAAVRRHRAEASNSVDLWSRTLNYGPEGWVTDLDFSDLQPAERRATVSLWNGGGLRPAEPKFSAWHRDVVSSFQEAEDRATASFTLPDRPFSDDDPKVFDQHFVVSVNARQYGAGLDDRTFSTPFVSELNEFYGRNFHFVYDHARAELGSFGCGAVGIITSLGSQQLSVNAIRIHEWLKAFFAQAGVGVERSEPGRRCSRLVRQMGGLQGCRVFKVRGARDLIASYGPDQSFTRSAAEKKIGNYDEVVRRMRFEEFEHLYIQRRERGWLTPGEVFDYLIGKAVFRAGLEFVCPNCELNSWLGLDDVATLSTCTYCGNRFDVTAQLKDRDWRYRRSGLFGRDDNQLGGIPVALTLQQLEIALHDQLLMYSTALSFSPATATVEACEVDFLAVTARAGARNAGRVQILFGEAKTHSEFDAEDVRKLGRLADAIPSDLADAFIMFAKTDTFTEAEARLAQTLNQQYRKRVILWSREELEPYHVYERSKDRLGRLQYASTLTDMAVATERLWFQLAPCPPAAG